MTVCQEWLLASFLIEYKIKKSNKNPFFVNTTIFQTPRITSYKNIKKKLR